jgi:hypothetical protein
MKLIPAVVISLSLLGTTVCHAIPLLQIYVEDATYDTTHESWVFGNANGDPIRLWVIGNTKGPGSKGTIKDVKLAITYADLTQDKDATVNVTKSNTDGYGGYSDPSDSLDPVWKQYDQDGDIPLMGDGKPISRHGVYGEGWEWQEFALGDFYLADSPIGDFIGDFPKPSANEKLAQINVYEIDIVGDITEVHFDAYDHVQSGNKAKYIFAPYSHDAGTGVNESVPVPTTLALVGLGLAGITYRRKQIKAA